MFSAEIYQKRRKKLISELQNEGLIILPGNNETPMNYKGNPFKFRQDSTFLYFTGIDLPGLAVTIDTASGETILYGNERTIGDAIWTGTQPSLSEQAEESGISNVKPLNNIFKIKEKNQILHYLPSYTSERELFISEITGYSVLQVKSSISKKLIQAVVKQRSIKSEKEVAQIEDALIRATSKFHIDAMKMAVPGEFEYRIAGHIEGTAIKNKCSLAYNTICSVRGEVLHNQRFDNILKQGQMLLIDAGAENPMHYASDITRTTPVGGRFSNQQKNIYSIVLKAVEESIHLIKPGISYKSVHLNAAKIIAAGLVDLGIMNGDVDEIVELGAHALFFPHGLGHMIGLDVHDMEDLGEDYVGYDEEIIRSEQFGTAFLRLGRKLQKSFTITVEPGIYFIPALIEKWAGEKKFNSIINYNELNSYLNFGGIRIEENIALSENGCRVLGKPIPRTISQIESMV